MLLVRCAIYETPNRRVRKDRSSAESLKSLTNSGKLTMVARYVSAVRRRIGRNQPRKDLRILQRSDHYEELVRQLAAAPPMGAGMAETEGSERV